MRGSLLAGSECQARRSETKMCWQRSRLPTLSSRPWACRAGQVSAHVRRARRVRLTASWSRMLVDDIGDVTISNDGATILQLLEVDQPAGRILVELAQQQDKEVGDGTTSVVIIAAELLRRANDLVKSKVHPTTIITGYRLACREACKYMQEQLATKVDSLGKDSLINVAKTSMASKVIGSDDDFFAQLAVDAMLAVKTINPRGEIKYPVKAVNILKAHGKSARESLFINGLANLEGEETFEASNLGSADEVSQERVSDDELILIRGTKTVSSSSIVLRGANDYLLDEMERALHDSLCVIKRTLESGSVVPGGGAVESALSIYLENFATTLGSREQLAIAEFAQALLVIPKTLAVNAAKDSTDLIAKLRAYHNAAQNAGVGDPKKNLRFYGLDLLNGQVRDNLRAGVLEPTVSKVRSLKSALEAATGLLRIDDAVRVEPPPQQEDPHAHM
ncbi:hypothetical protein L7F22_009825 [Adiantum nelumboides]|nr:hypothetical protein [Adiantum nelumboides]